MPLISCPECGRSGVSDQAPNCPGCGHPIKRYEYTEAAVNTRNGDGSSHLYQLQREGWEVVGEHEEPGGNSEDGYYPFIVYRLRK